MGLKIAFYPMGPAAWSAGAIFLKNLMYSIRYTYPKDVESYIICLEASSERIPSEIKSMADGAIVIPKLSRLNPLRIADHIFREAFSYNLKEESLLRNKGIDVIFGNSIRYSYGKIPLLSWIYDFQHVHFPESYSEEIRLGRDECFLKTARLSSRIIVLSESVKKDFEKFAPQYAFKARIMRFNAHIPDSIYQSDLVSLVKLYNLPEKFIYLPNQFWVHKNHEIVFQAVKHLKDMGKKIFIVCSGYPYDFRDTGYFSDLFEKISQWGIREQVAYLGMIPYEHVLLLMRQCACVLNPSLFEGFGITTNEAKVLGKRLLLSDIPAHREQDPPKATFFNPRDMQDLAGKLDRIWQESMPGPDFELEQISRSSQDARIKECANSFMSFIKEVVK